MTELEGAALAPAPTDRVWTLPNVLSFLRLATVPVFLWLFIGGHEEAAVILYGAGAWTDFFDGYLARRMGAVSELGKLLDPVADRVFIVALAIALVARDALPVPLALVILVRDVVLLVAFPLLERRGIERVRVNFVGKTATASLLFGLTLLAWSQTTWPGTHPTHWVGMAFTIFGAVLYWVAASMYAREAFSKVRGPGGVA